MHTHHHTHEFATDDQSVRCRELVELITDYLEDALPPARRAQFDAHLRECAVCCAYVADMALLVERIGDLRRFQPTPRERDRLLALFHEWRTHG